MRVIAKIPICLTEQTIEEMLTLMLDNIKRAFNRVAKDSDVCIITDVETIIKNTTTTNAGMLTILGANRPGDIIAVAHNWNADIVTNLVTAVSAAQLPPDEVITRLDTFGESVLKTLKNATLAASDEFHEQSDVAVFMPNMNGWLTLKTMLSPYNMTCICEKPEDYVVFTALVE